MAGSSVARALLLPLLVAATWLAGAAVAQDPDSGWMAYAVGQVLRSRAERAAPLVAPAQVPAGTSRVTRLRMRWTVGANAKSSDAFFTPWYGAIALDWQFVLRAPA